jgi:tight adherence protein C
MNTIDFVIIGFPLMTGFFLLCRCLMQSSLPRVIVCVPKKVIRLHRKAHRRLVDGKSFSIPGGGLVTSLRCWFTGEVVGLSITALNLALNPSPSRISLSVILGLCLGSTTTLFIFRREAIRQIESVRSSLPVASFLLSLLLEAGMGSHAAFQEAAHAIPNGPLARELEDISRARILGISREEAVERSRKRVPLEDYHIFLNLVRQGERLGVGLSRALREHSSKMLEGEAFRAEATAQKAAVKLLFPLVVFIFPAVVLIIFSPILLNIWEIWGR